MAERKDERKEEKAIINVLDMPMQANRKLMDSAGEIGQFMGNFLALVDNRDRVELSGWDYAKLFGMLGVTMGAIVGGAKEAKRYHDERMMLPSELNTRIAAEIAEMEEAKKTLELKEKLESLREEVIALPTPKKESRAKISKSRDEIRKELRAKTKEVEELRKKLKSTKK